jgi:hypothetical protein
VVKHSSYHPKVECFSSKTTTVTERKNDEKTVDSGHGGSKVVKHLLHHPKVEYLSLSPAVSTGREKMKKSSKLFYMEVAQW